MQLWNEGELRGRSVRRDNPSTSICPSPSTTSAPDRKSAPCYSASGLRMMVEVASPGASCFFLLDEEMIDFRRKWPSLLIQI